MNRELQQIVTELQRAERRANPDGDADEVVTPDGLFLSTALQVRIVNAGLKPVLSEGDVINAALELGIDPGDLVEELASWL